MSEQLNFRRLGLLIRTHWLENFRLYLLSIASITGLLAIAIFLQLTGRSTGVLFYTHELFPIYIFGLGVSGSIFASTSSSNLSEKAKGIYWLTLPASHLEKLITITLYTMIVFPVVYSFCFLAVKEVALAFIPKEMLIRDGNLSRNTTLLEEAKAGFFFFLAVQSFFLLGGIYFRRYSFIKTAIAGALSFILFIVLLNKLDAFVFHDKLNTPRVYWDGLQGEEYVNNGMKRFYRYPEWLLTPFVIVAKNIWAPVFLLTAWFRLKEKQI